MSLIRTFGIILGALDGSYIRVTQPERNLVRDYTNRKGFCSVTMMAVCKANMEFIDVSTGWPSSMHDNRIFQNSFLGQHVDELIPHPYHLIADKAFINQEKVLTPYIERRLLTDVRKLSVILYIIRN